MTEKILFSLEQCMKCVQTKQLMTNREDISVVTLPHEITDWNNDQMHQAKEYDVFDDLQKTAPILWIDGEKHIGYLRIRKWLQDNKL